MPPRTNIADHVMHLIQTYPLEKLPRDNENRRRYHGELPPPDIIDDIEKQHSKKFLKSLSNVKSLLADEDKEEAKPNVFEQSWHLAVREFKSLYRDTATLAGRLGGAIVLNVLFAIIFLHAGDQSRSKYTVTTAFGAMVQVFMCALFTAVQPAVMNFPLERVVFMRERATGTYGTIPYIFSKLIVELPVDLVTVLIILLITYWSIGFNGNFGLLLLSMWLLMLATTSTAMILGAVAPNAKVR